MSAVEAKPFEFSKAAKKFNPKATQVLAVRHVGEPQQYPTKHGTETAYDGDYVVAVGHVIKTVIIPPSVDEKGVRKPGEHREVSEPLLEVMKAQDFEALYEPK